MKYRFSQEIEVQVKYIGFVKNKSLTKKKYRFSQELEVQPRGDKSLAKVSKGLVVSLQAGLRFRLVGQLGGVGSMEVRVGKNLTTKKNWSKVSNQKRLTMVECWLT